MYKRQLNVLNEYEFNDIVTLDNVINAIQRAEMVMKIVDEVQRGISELGQDGRLSLIHILDSLSEKIKDLQRQINRIVNK